MARTENLTIMFTDVVGYTERTSAQSRGQIRDLLQRCKTILLPIVHRYGGWQVKNLGDALLIAFRSPTDALRCGMAQHDAVAASNRELPPEQHLHIRVAVALGEVLVQDRDVFGEAVNLAARLENVTPADRLYFTEAVYLAMNKAEVPSEVVGVEQFKGIPEPVKVYQVPPRQVARLIPAAEPLSTPEPELPFGGAHLLGAEVPLAARMRGRWQELLLHAGHAGQQVGLRARWLRADVAAAALLMLAAALWAWRLWPPAPSAADVPAAAEPAATASVTAAGASSLLAQAEPLLAARRHDEVRALYEARLQKNPRDAEALLLRGHDLFRQNQRSAAVSSYAEALQIEPALHTDTRLARNLAQGLSWAAEESTPLIRQYPTPALIDALAERTAEAGAPLGRSRAAALLQELGHGDRIDRAGMALEELREAQSCEQRLAAVRKLRPLRDARAKADLEALLTGGLQGWWENRCVRDEARAALDAIQKKK
jgi:class 3 adenylate cyclase